jgi:hypothetical protein
MIETALSLAPQPSTVIAATSHAQRVAWRQARAVAVLVQRAAVATTKRKIQAEGRRKLSEVPVREIVAMAETRIVADAAYRARLIAEARPIVDQWTAEGVFGKRAALAAHNLKDLHKERGPEPQAFPLCKTHEQNGAGK